MAHLKQGQAAILLNQLGQEILASFSNFEMAFDVSISTFKQLSINRL